MTGVEGFFVSEEGRGGGGGRRGEMVNNVLWGMVIIKIMRKMNDNKNRVANPCYKYI